jgi:hypothetical protein
MICRVLFNFLLELAVILRLMTVSDTMKCHWEIPSRRTLRVTAAKPDPSANAVNGHGISSQVVRIGHLYEEEAAVGGLDAPQKVLEGIERTKFHQVSYNGWILY